MIVPEEEAKTLRCCGPEGCGGGYTTIAHTSLGQLPPGFGQTTERLCIGSRCMAWRWQKEPEEVGSGRNWHGYCGLAGKMDEG